MKRLTQMKKVLILTFCLLLMLFNFHQLLKAQTDCELYPDWQCKRYAEVDCIDRCEEEEEECDYVTFWYGECYAGICFQWFNLYCESGFLDSEEYVCMPSDCPWK